MKQKEKKYIVIIGAVVLIITVIGLFIFLTSLAKDNESEVITKSTLEKIVNISELSTFESIYNGIAEARDGKNDEKIDFYIAYEARVKAGINVEEIVVDVNYSEKIVTVDIPDVIITDVLVDITSMDYIFLDDKANTETVSEKAYKLCIEDVEKESKSQTAIIDLAEENAKNIVEALVKPFINQADAEYTIEIR